MEIIGSAILGGRDFSELLLHHLDLAPKHLELLVHLSTVGQLLSVTVTDLQNHGFRKAEAENVFRVAVSKRFNSMNFDKFTAVQLSSYVGRLSLGCPYLDHMFQGGLLPASLTEITGAAGVGKTQFCLQLCLTAQLPTKSGGLNGETLYLCTELVPVNRMKTIADSHPGTLDKIYVENLRTFDEVIKFLTSRIHDLLLTKPVKLLIVDSTTSIFRYVYDDVARNSFQNTDKIRKLAEVLHRLVDKYQLIIVCTNQVTSDFSVNSNSCLAEPVPALGITWGNFVTTRIVLTKAYKRKQREDVQQIERVIRVEFSPALPPCRMKFEIQTAGVQGCPVENAAISF